MRGPIPASWNPHLLSVFRVVVAFLFIAHGTQKLFGFPSAEERAPAELFSMMGLAGVLEFGGGLLLLAGLATRIVAFILAGQMAVAYFVVHAGNGFWPILNQGELAVFYCFAFLYLASAGPGPWSLDAIIARRASDRTANEARTAFAHRDDTVRGVALPPYGPPAKPSRPGRVRPRV